MKVLLLMFSLLALRPTAGYPGGPPKDKETCLSMFPTGHNANAMEIPAPYELTISSTQLVMKQSITVTLRTKPGHPDFDYYEGMYVQARMATCDYHDPVGSFSIPTGDPFLQLMNCSSNPKAGVAHKSKSHETTKTFTWIPPDSVPGHFFFRATVVKNESTFWTDVFSPFVEDPSDKRKVPTTYCEVQKTAGGTLWKSNASLVALLVFIILFKFF